jgi:ribosomal protein S18 acetylase RimI-like enzyme
VRAVEIEELGHVPFVRHQVDPATVEGSWTSAGPSARTSAAASAAASAATSAGASARASVVLARRPLPRGRTLVATGFGPEEQLRPLLAQVATAGVRPERVMVDAPVAVVPRAWPLTELRTWHWMLSTTTPPADPARLERVSEEAEVSALLDAAAPDSLARPGTPGVESWHGLREDGTLVAVGALVRQPDGTGHVRAVTVAPAWRGRGLGRALSTGLTRLAQAGTGIASLGVYTDNAPALAIYRGLGYEVRHTFTTGPVAAVSAGRDS